MSHNIKYITVDQTGLLKECFSVPTHLVPDIPPEGCLIVIPIDGKFPSSPVTVDLEKCSKPINLVPSIDAVKL